MANTNMSVEDVCSTIRKVDETVNKQGAGGGKGSSPVYGTRKTASAAHEQTSNGGGLKESGFMMAPNSIKGPRRR